MNMSSAVPFTVPFGRHFLAGDILSNGATADAVILHGAGKSCRRRFRALRAGLFEHGVSSLAFDMIGHGDTGGDLSTSSLKERTQQAISVIRHSNLSEPLSIIGASMSGYTAVRLTRHFDVRNLILFVPAMYSRHAYSLCFNDGFSKVIRGKKSWLESDAWETLSRFRGNLLLITAENDEVIPKAVIRNILESATTAAGKSVYEVPGSPHQILGYLAKHPRMFQGVIQKTMSILVDQTIFQEPFGGHTDR